MPPERGKQIMAQISQAPLEGLLRVTTGHHTRHHEPPFCACMRRTVNRRSGGTIKFCGENAGACRHKIKTLA